MADYYTPTVIDPVIPICSILPVERMFLGRVFDQQFSGNNAYYFSETGANDSISMPAQELRAALEIASPVTSRLARHLIENYADELSGSDAFALDGCGELWPEILQDIVRRCPDLDHITVTMAYTCSAMRPDGFGGFSMMITVAEIRWASTAPMFDQFYKEALANREISHGNS